VQEGEGFSVEAFPVLGQPAAAIEPGDGAFDDPALGQHNEALGLIRAFDDFDVELGDGLLGAALEHAAAVAAIGIEFEQEGIEAKQRRHHQHAAIPVLNAGMMHEGMHQEALGIDENVPLLAFDLFARIVTRRVRGPPFSALFTLWLSMIAAVGEASRSARSRHRT